MGISRSRISTSRTSPDPQEFPAKWMCTAKLLSKYQDDKFNKFSAGIKSVNGNTIVRIRDGPDKIDGARWCRGFTQGKHVFEIAFPCYKRGKHASIGFGTKTAAISTKDTSLPVGSGPDSWGIDLTSRKAMHNGKVIKQYPQMFKKVIPDRFYMYIDFDLRCLYFGNDEYYFGTAITDIDAQESPLYPMVTCSLYGATVTMVYRGKGKEITGPIRQKR